MLSPLADGHNHSAAAAAAPTITTQDARTRARNLTEIVAGEPLSVAASPANGTFIDADLMAARSSLDGGGACSQYQQDRILFLGGDSHSSEIHQQQSSFTASQPGFCGSNETGVELGFNPMDYSFSELEPLWVRKQWPDILMRCAFVAPIVLLGIVGNLTIIWSICKFKSFRSKPTNIFILSMAIADLITALVCPLAALFTDIYQFYVLGSLLCRLEGSIKITCLLVSAYSLNWLSFIWLRHIVQPCRTRISIKQSWLILAGIWMGSILMASPLFCWRMLRSRQWQDLNEIWCCELIHISKYYWVVITFIIVYLPLLFMTIILVVILIQMDKFEAKLRRTRTNQSNSSLTINMKYRRLIVKVLLLYLGISVVCWAPFQFSIIQRHFRTEACLSAGYSDFVFASQLLASVPGALNPFVFGFLSQPFRKIVSAFWMVKLLDKLFIWKRRPPSDQNHHQMALQQQAAVGSAKATALATSRHQRGQQQQANAAAITAVHHQSTTRIRSGSTSTKRTAPTSTTNNNNNNTQRQQRSVRLQGISSRHRVGGIQQSNGSKLDGQVIVASCNQAPPLKGIPGRRRQQQHRGCENAAYESTVGDFERQPSSKLNKNALDEDEMMNRQQPQIGTTSFTSTIRQQQQQQQQVAHYQLEAARLTSAASVVSMDSINIEENLGNVAAPSTIDETTATNHFEGHHQHPHFSSHRQLKLDDEKNVT